jgi:hypothetical protein
MKNFLTTVYSILESIGRTRAAMYYARQGNYEAAKQLMVK